MTPRKVAVLVINLPPGAALWSALGIDGAWTPEAHLLAATVDLLSGANWQRGGGQGQRPKPIDRPSEMAQRAAAVDRHVERAERFLARQKTRGGQS